MTGVGPVGRPLLPRPPRRKPAAEPAESGRNHAAVEVLHGPRTATARLVAGGEDGSQVRRPERPRLPPAAIAGGPPVADGLVSLAKAQRAGPRQLQADVGPAAQSSRWLATLTILRCYPGRVNHGRSRR